MIHASNPKEAKCRYCADANLNAHLRTVKDHAASKTHKTAVSNAKSALVSSSSLQNFIQPVVSDTQKELELAMAAFIAKHTSFLAADDLTELVLRAQPKLAGKKMIKMGRTKCTKLITNVLAPGFKERLLSDVGNGKFSLIIDESTDISTTALLCIVIRYLSGSLRKIVTTFYRLVQLSSKDAASITMALVNVLIEDGLDLRNLVGIGCDGASVLTGHNSGVFARLKEYSPHLLLVRCVCHSLHLAASDAFDELPSNLPAMVRQTYDWFCRSSCRQEKYAQLYIDINGKMPKKLCRLGETRWLSLFNCVSVILEQWDSLAEYFSGVEQSEKGDNKYVACSLSAMFADTTNKLYMTFCRSLLLDFVRVNLLFQSENADSLKLIRDLRLFYEKLLRKFALPDRLDKHPYSSLETFDFERYICPTSAINFGMDFTQLSDTLDAETTRMIRERCKNCLIQAARQVRKRLPDSLDSLCLLEILSPEHIVKKISGYWKIDCKISDLDKGSGAAEDEFRSLSFEHDLDPGSDVVQFWLKVRDLKDAGGCSRFNNICDFALALLCLPISNASAERVFSIMNIVKNKLRNRLLCHSVDAVITVRYAFILWNISLSSFKPSKQMLLRFTDSIYMTKNVAPDEDQESVIECLSAVDVE